MQHRPSRQGAKDCACLRRRGCQCAFRCMRVALVGSRSLVAAMPSIARLAGISSLQAVAHPVVSLGCSSHWKLAMPLAPVRRRDRLLGSGRAYLDSEPPRRVTSPAGARADILVAVVERLGPRRLGSLDGHAGGATVVVHHGVERGHARAYIAAWQTWSYMLCLLRYGRCCYHPQSPFTPTQEHS